MEHLVFFCHKLMGRQTYWLPRLFSMLFWFVGAAFLYQIGLKLFGREGAFFSTGIYIFFPFGINISRAFMPESLMMMFALIALFFIHGHYSSARSIHLLAAAFFSGLAILVKFIVIFPLFGVFILAGIQKHGLKKFVLSFQTFLFFALSSLLGVGYYIYILFNVSSLFHVARTVFIPKMLFSASFWEGWIKQIGRVTGWLPLLFGLAALLTLKNRRTKAFLWGILIGYLVFAFLAVYSTAMIDYYHISLYLFVSLASGQLGASIAEYIKKKKSYLRWVSFVFLFCFLLLCFYSLSTANWAVWNNDFKKRLEITASILCGNQLYFGRPAEIGQEVKKAQEIGRKVGHSIKTIFLADDYGFPLMFHGVFFGKYWPDKKELDARRLQGEPPLEASELYLKDYSQWQTDYFIVENMALWEEQPDLQEFIQNYFFPFAQGADYLIFKLKKPIPPRK